MDYICNKCYISKVRTNKPFRLTQCKHIFCDSCIKYGNNNIFKESLSYYLSRIHEFIIVVTGRCTVCGFKGPASISLQEPLPPEVASYFKPIDETLMSLKTATGLQTVQLNIILERFDDIRKKYHSLKSGYHNVIHKTEYLTRKCNEYRNNIKDMEEVLNHHKGVSPYAMSTSSDTVFSADVGRFQSDSYSSISNAKPEGFRIPTSCKVSKSIRKYGKRSIDTPKK